MTRPSPPRADPRRGQAGLARVALVLGVLVVPAAALPWLGPAIRLPIVLAFVCFGPGAAFVAMVRMGDRVSSWATAFVLSLALNGFVASVMVWTSWWHPPAGFAVLAVPSVLVAAMTLWPGWHRRLLHRVMPTGTQPAADRTPTGARRAPVGVRGRTATVGPAGSVAYAERGRGVSSRAGADETDLLATWLTLGREQASAGTPHSSVGAPAESSDATAMLPRVVDEDRGLDSTALLPRVVDEGRGLDSTALLPRVVDDDRRSDATALLPRVADDGAGPDATALLPRVVDESRGLDSTALLPRVADDRRGLDSTTVLPPISGGPGPARPRRTTAAAAARRAALARAHRRSALMSLGIASAVLLLWLVSLALSPLDEIDSYGLLPAMHPTYFMALGLCTAGFVLELGRRGRLGWILLTYVGLLVLIMRATVPLLSSAPQYSWTYKHVGVVEVFRTYGEVIDSTDIYQQWPTLFALVAQVVSGSGVDALDLAGWAPVFFNVAFCVPLFALARTLATDPRVPYLTVFIYTATNWVGQDYLAPQAFAFTLSLGVLLVIIRWLRRQPSAPRPRPRRIDRIWARVAAGLPPVPYTSRHAAWAATVAMSVIFLIVVAAHQLSPYIVAMSAVAVVALGLVRSYRIIPIVVGLAIGYLVPRYEIVDDYGLFSGFNFFRNASTTAVAAAASPGRALGGDVARIMALVVVGLAFVAVASSLRRPGPIALPALLAFSPFGILVAQSYGGEGMFRVILFASPWCAYLIATLVLRRSWLPWAAAIPAGAVALTVAVLGSMQAGQGQFMSTYFTRDEVAIVEYLYEHAEPGSELVNVAANYPGKLSANYGDFDHTALIDERKRLGLFELTEAGAQVFDDRWDDGVATYLVVTPSMTRYLQYYGYMPAETVAIVEQRVKESPRWQEFYRIGDSVIYRRAPGQDAAVGPDGQVRS